MEKRFQHDERRVMNGTNCMIYMSLIQQVKANASLELLSPNQAVSDIDQITISSQDTLKNACT